MPYLTVPSLRTHMLETFSGVNSLEADTPSNINIFMIIRLINLGLKKYSPIFFTINLQPELLFTKLHSAHFIHHESNFVFYFFFWFVPPDISIVALFEILRLDQWTFVSVSSCERSHQVCNATHTLLTIRAYLINRMRSGLVACNIHYVHGLVCSIELSIPEIEIDRSITK